MSCWPDCPASGADQSTEADDLAEVVLVLDAVHDEVEVGGR